MRQSLASSEGISREVEEVVKEGVVATEARLLVSLGMKVNSLKVELLLMVGKKSQMEKKAMEKSLSPVNS